MLHSNLQYMVKHCISARLKAVQKVITVSAATVVGLLFHQCAVPSSPLSRLNAPLQVIDFLFAVKIVMLMK